MKKVIVSLAAFILVSVPSFAQTGKMIVKGVAKTKVPVRIKPPKISVPGPAVAARVTVPVSGFKVPQQVAQSLFNGKIPTISEIKMLDAANLQKPTWAEFQKQTHEHGVVVREIKLPTGGEDRVFSEDGEHWLYSKEALEAIDSGFRVYVLEEDRLAFSVDGEAPFFDFYDGLVLHQVKKLKELGFVLNSSGRYFMVHFPQTPVSETPVFLDQTATTPILLKDAPVGAVLSKHTFLPGAEGTPYPDLYVACQAEAKPKDADWDLWTNHLMGYMQDAAKAYQGLENTVNTLGSAKNSVDIVWNGYSWSVRDVNGKMYQSAKDFMAENAH